MKLVEEGVRLMRLIEKWSKRKVWIACRVSTFSSFVVAVRTSRKELSRDACAAMEEVVARGNDGYILQSRHSNSRPKYVSGNLSRFQLKCHSDGDACKILHQSLVRRR